MASEAPIISSTHFKILAKKVHESQGKEKKPRPGKASSSGGEQEDNKKKKQKGRKPFAVRPSDPAEYEALVTKLESTIGTATDFNFIPIGDRYAVPDSYTGQPCLYYFHSIPTDAVGVKRAAGIKACTDLFLGTFISHLSLFAYLLHRVKLGRDHVMVQQAMEWFGYSQASFDKKFPPERLQAFAKQVETSRLIGNGTANIPFQQQLGKTQKILRNASFFNGRDQEIQEGRNVIDTDRVLSESLRNNSFGYAFNSFADFEREDRKVRDQKKKSAEDGKYWSDRIREVGEEQAMKEFTEKMKENDIPIHQVAAGGGGKRKRVSGASSSSGSRKQAKAEEHAGLRDTMASVAGKIRSRSSEDFYDIDLGTSDEEEDEFDEDDEDEDMHESEVVVLEQGTRKIPPNSPASVRKGKKA
jgi:hypothetical protein